MDSKDKIKRDAWFKLFMRHAHLLGTEPTGLQPSVAPHVTNVPSFIAPLLQQSYCPSSHLNQREAPSLRPQPIYQIVSFFHHKNNTKSAPVQINHDVVFPQNNGPMSCAVSSRVNPTVRSPKSITFPIKPFGAFSRLLASRETGVRHDTCLPSLPASTISTDPFTAQSRATPCRLEARATWEADR